MPKKASQASIRQSLVLTDVKWTSILSRPIELFLLFWPVLNVYYTQGDNSDEKNDYILIVSVCYSHTTGAFSLLFSGPRHSSDGKKASSKHVPPRSKSKLIPGRRPVLACFFPIGVTMCDYCVNLVACFGQTFPIQLLVSFLLQLPTCFFFFCRPPRPLAKSQWNDKHTGIQGSIGVYEQCISFDWHGPRLIPISERPPEVQTNGHSVHGFLSAKDTFSSIFFEAALLVLRFCKRRDSDGLWRNIWCNVSPKIIYRSSVLKNWFFSRCYICTLISVQKTYSF